jgi:phage tail sheath protein FI
VHYAPANKPISGASGLRQQVTRQEQELLNPRGQLHPELPCRGIRIWGAHADRRGGLTAVHQRPPVAPHAEESIAEGTRWIVFQPNDHELWSSIGRTLAGS